MLNDYSLIVSRGTILSCIFVPLIILMAERLKKIFVKATPVSILTILGLTLCSFGMVYLWLNYDDHGGLASGLLAVLLLLFGIVYVLDRYLVEKFAWRIVFVLESVLILATVLVCLFRM